MSAIYRQRDRRCFAGHRSPDFLALPAHQIASHFCHDFIGPVTGVVVVW